jgi:nitroimidazol reductase NimA-like FMN-containing flavoprotein (pyridoxamine 5'-phosphate oxidase superfamily)
MARLQGRWRVIMTGMTDLSTPVSDRTTVRRLPDRGRYDRAEIDAILDEGLVCHIGFIGDSGHPVVIPTTYARDGDSLVVHGSPASRMLRSLKDGVDMCLTVTLIDGMVLARSAFHHSMNYRSVVVFGRAEAITDQDEKHRALEVLVDHLVPGRTASARGPSEMELRSTLVLRLALDEASAKVRTGPPIDDEEDLDLPVWAGVLPLGLATGAPLPDPHMAPGAPVPEHVAGWSRGTASASP